MLIRLLFASFLTLCFGCDRADVIEYHGQQIKLSRSYSDFDEYKNDLNNIHPSERSRVQELVKTAPVPHSLPNDTTLFRFLSNLAFPGYGSGLLARTRQRDGSEILAHGTEIPGTEQDRYLVFRSAGQSFELIDDFIDQTVIGPATVTDEGTELVYRRADGRLLFRRSKTVR